MEITRFINNTMELIEFFSITEFAIQSKNIPYQHMNIKKEEIEVLLDFLVKLEIIYLIFNENNSMCKKYYIYKTYKNNDKIEFVMTQNKIDKNYNTILLDNCYTKVKKMENKIEDIEIQIENVNKELENPIDKELYEKKLYLDSLNEKYISLNEKLHNLELENKKKIDINKLNNKIVRINISINNIMKRIDNFKSNKTKEEIENYKNIEIKYDKLLEEHNKISELYIEKSKKYNDINRLERETQNNLKKLNDLDIKLEKIKNEYKSI